MSLKFELSDEQEQVALKWLNEHDCSMIKFMKETGSSPAAGERVRFVFVPTMLGTVSVIECLCGANHILTDWSDF